MGSNSDEIVHDFPQLLLRVYKDGRVERLKGNEFVPPSTHPDTGVQSKDVVLAQETGVSARLYVPGAVFPGRKLPLLIYFPGGGFCIESAFSPLYHNYLNSVVAEAGVVAVSVEYRRAPEHLLPVAYDDCWAAVKWAVSGGAGEVWLKDHVDFDSVFFAGDSAGANIAHNMAMRVALDGLQGARLVGIILVHPYFSGKEPVASEAANLELKDFADNLWRFVCPGTTGPDDPLINPVMDPKLSSLSCSKVLVCVAGNDFLRDRGWYYCEGLKKSGWGGKLEVMEAEGEDHVFHLLNPTCEKARVKLRRIVSFLNE